MFMPCAVAVLLTTVTHPKELAAAGEEQCANPPPEALLYKGTGGVLGCRVKRAWWGTECYCVLGSGVGLGCRRYP